PLHPSNPFLINLYDDVQPSTINPFQSFFDSFENPEEKGTGQQQQQQQQQQQSGQESPQLLLNGSYHSEDLNASVDSTKPDPHAEVIDKLKQIQIVDSYAQEDPYLSDESVDTPYAYCPDFPEVESKDGWPLMMRIPEKKTKMSSRQWGNIYTTVSDGLLMFYYEKGLEKPFKEFQLQPDHELSEPRLENFNELGKIHTIRIECVSFKEKRRYPTKILQAHGETRTELLKLGTPDYNDFTSFLQTIRDQLMHLTVPLDRCSVYTEDTMEIEVADEFRGILRKDDSNLVKHSVTTHVYAMALVSGKPECVIGLNDIDVRGKESVNRQHIIASSCNNRRKYACLKRVNGPPAVRFYTVSLLEPCENVMVRYPVPPDWVKIFRTENFIKQKSLLAKVNKSAKFGTTSVSGSEPVMRVTIGTAKYEHAYNAIVWRIDRLPDKNAAPAADHPHCFSCRLELGSDQEVPRGFFHSLEAEFDMQTTTASGANIRSVSVVGNVDAIKNISYRGHYRYQVAVVEMEKRWMKVGEVDEDKPGECSQQ
uniref:Stonin 2 n=1 Tax=Petromyzon marinus TaxID=7757 RepID=S4R6U4_PETMA